MIGRIFAEVGSRENREEPCRRGPTYLENDVFFEFPVEFPVESIHDILFSLHQVNCEAVSLLLSAAEEAGLKRLVRVTGKARKRAFWEGYPLVN